MRLSRLEQFKPGLHAGSLLSNNNLASLTRSERIFGGRSRGLKGIRLPSGHRYAMRRRLPEDRKRRGGAAAQGAPRRGERFGMAEFCGVVGCPGEGSGLGGSLAPPVGLAPPGFSFCEGTGKRF